MQLNLNRFFGGAGLLSHLLYMLTCAVWVGQHVFLFLSISVCIYLAVKRKHISSINILLFVMAVSFILYASFRWVVAGADYLDIKAMTLGTSGGMLYGLFMGFLLVYLVNASCERRINCTRCSSFGVYVFLLVNLFTVLVIALYFSKQVRGDILLIEGANSNYQYTGNYMAMYIISVFYAFNNMRGSGSSITLYTLMLSIASVVIYICQILGSNSGAAIGILIIIVMMLLIPLDAGVGSRLSSPLHRKVNLVVTRYFYLISIVGISLMLLALSSSEVFINSVLGYDTAKLRMFAYGDGIGETFSSRAEILINNLSSHFNYSPLWGDPFVEIHTTGEGTYIHSLISVWTHLGIGGFVFFVLLLLSTINPMLTLEKSRLKSFYNGNSLIIVLYTRFFLFSVIFLLAFATTFFTWLPLWFVIGMLCINPYFIRPKLL